MFSKKNSGQTAWHKQRANNSKMDLKQLDTFNSRELIRTTININKSSKNIYLKDLSGTLV